MKSGHILSYSGPCFPAFGLSTERYSVSVRIQSECGRIRTRITPNTGTFYEGLVKMFTKLSYGVHKKLLYGKTSGKLLTGCFFMENINH